MFTAIAANNGICCLALSLALEGRFCFRDIVAAAEDAYFDAFRYCANFCSY